MSRGVRCRTGVDIGLHLLLELDEALPFGLLLLLPPHLLLLNLRLDRFHLGGGGGGHASLAGTVRVGQGCELRIRRGGKLGLELGLGLLTLGEEGLLHALHVLHHLLALRLLLLLLLLQPQVGVLAHLLELRPHLRRVHAVLTTLRRGTHLLL